MMETADTLYIILELYHSEQKIILLCCVQLYHLFYKVVSAYNLLPFGQVFSLLHLYVWLCCKEDRGKWLFVLWLLFIVYLLNTNSVEGGELFDRVVNVGRFEEKTAKLLFYQMLVAVKVSWNDRLLT